MAYRIEANTDFNSNEVYFDCKPEAVIITALKGLKMRWNGNKKCWYGYADKEALESVLNGTSARVPEKKNGVYTASPELLAEYETCINDVWQDAKMRKHCMDKLSTVWKCNNVLIDFEKPSIETSFCFDDSYDTEEQESHKMAQHARTSQNYFLEQNLKKFNEIIEALEGRTETYSSYYSRRFPVVNRGKYYRQSPDNCLGCLNWRTDYEWQFETSDTEKEHMHKLTAEEKAELLNVYKTERAKFEKRLNTYLKRYGLSKLNVWTYWGMA